MSRPAHITRYDKDKQYRYQIVTVWRGSFVKRWKEIILVEYSLPDNDGHFQRARTVANFGNASNDEHWRDARFLMTALIQCHNLV